MNKKGISNLVWIILGIVLLCVAGYFAFVKNSEQTAESLTQTSTSNSENETANWKTYTNTEYGFEFKYPPTITLEEKNSTITDTLVDKKIDTLIVSGDYLEILTWKTSPGNQVFTCYASEFINIAGYKVEKCLSHGLDSDEKGLETQLIRNGFTYRFYIGSYANNEAEANQILSTFKFTN